jgi:site-specific recombinase XerD
MAKASFFLKEPTAKTETLVFLYFNFGNKRMKYSTGEKINPKFWNSENQRAKETKQFKEYPEFNTRLNDCAEKVRTAYRKILNDGESVTLFSLRKELDSTFKKKEKQKKPELIGFIEKFIKETTGVRSANTTKAYQNALNHLKDYCKDKNCKIDFESIDMSFYNSYTKYLIEDIDLAQNTVGNNIKNLKVFMTEAYERGYHKNLEFRSRKFKKTTEETDKIYLNIDELDKIYKHDFSANKKLERVRDLFIIGCFTGLRFSDFTQLSKDNILENNKIKIRTQKNKDTVMIPLHPFVKEILLKYNWDIPQPITNQKMNEYLKEIGEKAEIKGKVQVSITKGGELQKTVFNKSKLISTHTARRSFASNLHNAGVSSITIMKITGHKTESSFLRYIRISQEENANKLLDHPFFK